MLVALAITCITIRSAADHKRHVSRLETWASKVEKVPYIVGSIDSLYNWCRAVRQIIGNRF